MKKTLLKGLSVATLIVSLMATVGCGGSPIDAIVAKDETVMLKLDDSDIITSFYTIETSKELTAAEKACTYASSNSSVVKITNKFIRAVGLGSAEITVTSNEDSSKYCKFTVNVSDTYFDREISVYDANDTLNYECPEDGGYIETTGSIKGEYYIKDVAAANWYIETDITVKSVIAEEGFPKFGIITNTFNASANKNSKVLFFLNAEIAITGNDWSYFGVCEVANGDQYAWHETITDATARHQDQMYYLPDGKTISYEDTFKLGFARQGYDFHAWVNDQYAGSFTTLTDLFYGNDGSPAVSNIGFFEFNSVTRFENYSYTINESEVQQKVNSISNPTYITEWTQSA